MSVANPNILDKNTKGDYDHYHHLRKDGEMFDYVGPLPPSTYNGVIYRYILIFVYWLSKMRYLAPASTQEVEEVAELFYQNIWKLHGLPDNFTSD